jgi:hypothetical protein
LLSYVRKNVGRKSVGTNSAVGRCCLSHWPQHSLMAIVINTIDIVYLISISGCVAFCYHRLFKINRDIENVLSPAVTNLDVCRKGKMHPCTGTETLYKPYGP